MAVDKENDAEEDKGRYFTSVDCCIWTFGSAHGEAEHGISFDSILVLKVTYSFHRRAQAGLRRTGASGRSRLHQPAPGPSAKENKEHIAPKVDRHPIVGPLVVGEGAPAHQCPDRLPEARHTPRAGGPVAAQARPWLPAAGAEHLPPKRPAVAAARLHLGRLGERGQRAGAAEARRRPGARSSPRRRRRGRRGRFPVPAEARLDVQRGPARPPEHRQQRQRLQPRAAARALRLDAAGHPASLPGPRAPWRVYHHPPAKDRPGASGTLALVLPPPLRQPGPRARPLALGHGLCPPALPHQQPAPQPRQRRERRRRGHPRAQHHRRGAARHRPAEVAREPAQHGQPQRALLAQQRRRRRRREPPGVADDAHPRRRAAHGRPRAQPDAQRHRQRLQHAPHGRRRQRRAPDSDAGAGDGPASPAATLRPRAASRLRRWFSRAEPGRRSPVVPPQPHRSTSARRARPTTTTAGRATARRRSRRRGRPSSEAGSRSLASEDYAATAATAATTPHSFSPTREASLESRSAAVAAKAAAAQLQQLQQFAPPRPSSSSTSSSGRRPSALVHPLAQHPQQPPRRPKRGLSIDTTLSGASSVATSVLGPASVADATAPVPPLHSGPVGVAY